MHTHLYTQHPIHIWTHTLTHTLIHTHISRTHTHMQNIQTHMHIMATDTMKIIVTDEQLK